MKKIIFRENFIFTFIIYQNCKYPVVNHDEPEIWKSVISENTSLKFTLHAPQNHEFGLIQQNAKP